MLIKPEHLYTLWYEDEEGNKFHSTDDVGMAPENYMFMHARFPNSLRESVSRLVSHRDVLACDHKHTKPTGGWIDNAEGRECLDCRGTQVKDKFFKLPFGIKIPKPWPKKWDAQGSREIMTMTMSWHDDLVLAIANSGDYTLSQAIIIVTTSCERCLNALCFKYGLKDGYEEYSDEWKSANTECVFCEQQPCEEDGGRPDSLGGVSSCDSE